MSPQLINNYKRRMVGFLESLKNTARKIGAGYILATTDPPVDEFIL